MSGCDTCCKSCCCIYTIITIPYRKLILTDLLKISQINLKFVSYQHLQHSLYSVSPHTVSSLNIYTFVVLRAFMAGAASQAGDADSSRAPGLTSGLQGSVNAHRGALLLVPQGQCTSSFVFYIKTMLIQKI